MMKHIPTVYLISMPYLVYFFLYLMSKTLGSWIALILCVAAIAIVCLIGIVSCVICNIISLKYMSDKESALRNYYIKIGHIPAHMMVVVAVAGMFNPFLMLLSWVPVVCGASLLIYSGAANICACIMLLKNKKCTVTEAVIFAVLAFIGILDFIAGNFQIIRAEKLSMNNTQKQQ